MNTFRKIQLLGNKKCYHLSVNLYKRKRLLFFLRDFNKISTSQLSKNATISPTLNKTHLSSTKSTITQIWRVLIIMQNKIKR